MPEHLITYLPDAALAAALAWGAGLKLYMVMFGLGVASRWAGLDLPEHLDVLASPVVLGATGAMLVMEFFADKLPWLDSVWDVLHTFIRIPAGAAMAAAVFGDSPAAVSLAAAILGGSITAATHFGKAGARGVINTSPEPVSNVATSLSEDVLVGAGMWLAWTQPAVFLAALAIFLLLASWAIYKLWRLVMRRKPSIRAS